MFPYEQAYEVGGLAAGLGALALLLWLYDGWLLLRGRLLPPGADPFDWAAWPAPAWRRAAAAWVLLGLPCGAQRWVAGHWAGGAVECALAALALALAAISGGGTLHGAFACAVAGGVLFLGAALVLWLRDLLQLLRGRLGPRTVPAPFFWALLLAATLGGPLGLHRTLLRRHRSAPLFMLFTAVIVFCALDAATDLTAHATSAGAGAINGVEIALARAAGAALAVALGRDVRKVLRGGLKPERESGAYWRVVYAWLLLGLPVGAHRLAAGKSTWRLFCILNACAPPPHPNPPTHARTHRHRPRGSLQPPLRARLPRTRTAGAGTAPGCCCSRCSPPRSPSCRARRAAARARATG